ncbi:MAG TPA: DUF2232 domain-containing protein [Hyphomicrobium sp.]|nr:DUF2232 domain-containing protein [Hyphomicrobium sp.]
MTPQSILLGLAAGFVSAIVFASATAGPLLSRMVLFLLTPFSLYLAGLGLGFLPLLIGSAAATTLILLLSNPLTALVYAASEALPAIALTRMTLVAREEDGRIYWYPIGRVIVAAALISGALSFAYLAVQGADVEALTKAIRPEVENFAKSLSSVPGGAQALGEAQIGEMTSIIVASLPGAVSLSLMLTALASLWLAGRVTLASGRLARPWPDFSKLELPLGSAAVLVAVTALSFTSDRMWLLSDGLASALRLAFALVGLAVVHHVTRASPWRGFILAATYTGLLILSRHAILILALIGLAETVFHYRNAAQRSPGPPS